MEYPVKNIVEKDYPIICYRVIGKQFTVDTRSMINFGLLLKLKPICGDRNQFHLLASEKLSLDLNNAISSNQVFALSHCKDNKNNLSSVYKLFNFAKITNYE